MFPIQFYSLIGLVVFGLLMCWVCISESMSHCRCRHCGPLVCFFPARFSWPDRKSSSVGIRDSNWIESFFGLSWDQSICQSECWIFYAKLDAHGPCPFRTTTTYFIIYSENRTGRTVHIMCKQLQMTDVSNGGRCQECQCKTLPEQTKITSDKD